MFLNWAIEALWCVADILLAIWDNRSVYHTATPDYEGLDNRTGQRAVSLGRTWIQIASRGGRRWSWLRDKTCLREGMSLNTPNGWNKVLCLLEVVAESTPWNWIELGVGISCREGLVTSKSLWDSFLKLLSLC